MKFKNLMLYFLIFFSFFYSTPRIEASKPSNCDFFLSSRSKSVQRLIDLNSQILLGLEPQTFSLEPIIYSLKKEMWRWLPNGIIPWKNQTHLPQHIQKSIKVHFSSKYRVEEMTESELTLFYTNQLRSIFQQMIREWMHQEFPSHIARHIVSRSPDFTRLYLDTLSPEDLQLSMKAREWQNYPWDEISKIEQKWKKANLEELHWSD